MKRRSFLTLLGATAAAGCSQGRSARGTPPGTPSLPPVDLEATDTAAENPAASLAVVYSSQVQPRIPLDAATEPDPGNKWLVLRADVTNRGERPRKLSANQYVITADEGEYEFTLTLADWALTSKRAEPGETVTGWVVFQLPVSVTDATLSVKDSLTNEYAITFSRDSSLNASIPG